jgi:transketolase
LQAEGIGAAVVSMPCTELFDAQDKGYKASVLGKGLKVAVEAASPYGWERYVGLDGIVVGLPSFGASGPADKVYAHFGITADAIAKAAKAAL